MLYEKQKLSETKIGCSLPPLKPILANLLKTLNPKPTSAPMWMDGWMDGDWMLSFFFHWFLSISHHPHLDTFSFSFLFPGPALPFSFHFFFL